MSSADTAVSRTKILSRLRTGETIAAVAADSGVSRSTLYRWRRATGRVTTHTGGHRSRLSHRGRKQPHHIL